MYFCKECENMLYIKLNKDTEDKLIYYCRKCNYEETNFSEDNICVLKTNLKKNTIKIDNLINEYTKMDPTLPHIKNIPCPNKDCNPQENDVIYMRYDHNNMKYLYICVHCDHIWKI